MSKKKPIVTEEELTIKNEIEVETLNNEDPTETLKNEIETLKDQLLRNQAELQNFKRRTNDERIKDRIFANADYTKQLLVTCDNLEIALKNETEDGVLKPHAKGFEMIYRDLLETLNDEGLKEIEALGKVFDPNLHQAVAKESVPNKEPNEVIEVYLKGYTFKNRVIRPAMVKVTE